MTAAVTAEEFQQALAITKSALQEAFRDDPGLEQRIPKARTGLERAEAELAAGNFVGPIFRIGNAASDLASAFYLRTDGNRARTLFELAVQLYESGNTGERYNGSIDFCRKHLATLGPAPVQDTAAPEVVEIRAQVPVQSQGPAATPVQPPLDEAEVVDVQLYVAPNWERLLDDWQTGGQGETPVKGLIDGLGAQIIELLTKNAPASAERLKPVIDEDLGVLAEHLADVTVPIEDLQVLHQRAKDARYVSQRETVQYARGGTVAELKRVRTHWLTSALWNHSLSRHWPSNGYQIVADILGYLQVIHIESRDRNDQRELLLSVTEGAALLTLGGLQDTEMKRAPQVYGWLRHAVGIQLHVGGPDPADPASSKFHERVQDPNYPNRHVHPEHWATHLLNQWVGKPEYRSSVAFSLLILSGWKADRLERMLDALYRSAPGAPAGPGSEETKAKARDFWRKSAMDMLATTRTVRVVKNAWEPGVATASSSLSMRDQDSSVQLSNRLLQGVAAELAPRSPGTMVQGALFAGRPVPTFLTFNNFGPVGVLKIDEAAKVQREKENFDTFGELLHPLYRSSKCVVGTTTIANSSNGSRYQGILTSYVFRDRDEPKTLRGWLRKAESDVLKNVIEELFLDALGPWLSDARRTIGDLRGEYPALRPASFERTSYAPGKDAESELAHFGLPEVGDTFGIEGGLPWHHRYLGPLLQDSALGRSSLVTERDHGATNPLWLVAHIADVSKPDADTEALFDWLLYDRQHGLTTRSYLTCVSHGDLHGENVLASGPEGQRPALYVIDFETTHHGHICKDFARLESALWSRTFPWNAEQLQQIRAWFGGALHGEALWAAEIPEDTDPEVRRVLTGVTKLRTILKGCEQQNWPFGDLEYQWALLASLLPFARYRDHETPGNRYLPFLLAADIADALVTTADQSK
ncbi:phosphotransferase family protein [Streptomyces sp. NPDC001514]